MCVSQEATPGGGRTPKVGLSSGDGGMAEAGFTLWMGDKRPAAVKLPRSVQRGNEAAVNTSTTCYHSVSKKRHFTGMEPS